MWWSRLFLALAVLPGLVLSLAATDEIQDADAPQSGYLPNHNLHPSTVGSSSFGILWKNTYNAKELFYAKPLTYTPTGGSQLVFLASSQNIIRTVDAVNGTLLNQRQVQPPFLQSDIGCTDIPNYIGITGTPIIDPNTDTVYFFSKGYQGQASSGGVALGRYSFYAVDIHTLADKPGFPILIDGHHADNDVTKYFVGGTVLQRPSLAMVNGVVIAGFGGHCDLFNYTGMLVAVSTTPGVGITSMYAMEGGPAAQPETDNIFNQAGGKAGIWQGGFGLAADNSRIFFATGNGQGHANGDIPASGRVPLTTLDEVVADFGVSAAGKLSLTDYFEPYEYVSMDAADRDLGSGGVALLDPNTFKGTGVSRIAVSVGKNGKAYILNADNLGGFKQGPGGTDNILQTIIAAGAVFGGSGSYPLEGGYIYFTPVGFPTVCYKLGLDDTGKPIFTLVGQTKTNSAGRVGIGIPTITTYKGQAGTGILWVTDPNNGLQAFNAVPDSTGTLTPIPLPATPGLNKFQRPAFGDGRVYVSDSNGNVYCLGSPVALPLTCTNPVNFGDLAIGNSLTLTITCTAIIPITKINGCYTADATFKCLNSSLPQGALAKGAQFSFPITWNLTQASINEAQNVSYGRELPGPVSSSLEIFTTNGAPLYSSILPINVQGNTVSPTAFLTISPPEVDFGGIVIGGSGQASGLSAAVIVSNIGSQTLTFTGFAWTTVPGGTANYTNITTNHDGTQKLGTAFSSRGMPAVGFTLPAGGSVTIPLEFNASTVGSYHSILQFWSNGGNDVLLMVGSAATSPIANISVSTIKGGWDFSEPVVMDFGNVLASTSALQNIRICNSGGSAMTITKSKPPVDPELFAARPLTDLHEGQTIDVNACALGEVDIVGAAAVVNQPPELISDTWTLNTDGLNPDGSPFGVHEVLIKASITRRQIGPLLPDGTARYKYLGCYQDVNRILPKGFSGGQTNDNAYCQNTCLANGYRFAGTEYHIECWCGNTPPPLSLFHAESEKKCTFSCPLDPTQACGGNGGYISVFYDSLNYAVPASASTSSTSTSTTSKSSTSSSSTSISTISTSISTSSTTSIPTSTMTTTTSSKSTTTTSTISTTSGVTSTTSSTTTSTTSTTNTSGPSVVPTAGAFSSAGCYTEATTGRALTGKRFAADTMTVEACATFCAGFSWFGVEYARECYCGNTLNAGSVPTTASECKMVCKGNALEYCGGPLRLNMYTNTTSSTSVTSTFPSTTISESSSSSLLSSSSSSTTTLATTTSTTATPSTSSSQTAATSTSATSTPAFTVSTAGATPTLGFYPQGCFSDPAGGPFTGHNMPLLFRNDSVNVELCISVALQKLHATPATTFSYIGLEYGRECYAATAPPTPLPSTVTGPKACTMTCKGNASETCGGSLQINLYARPMA